MYVDHDLGTIDSLFMSKTLFGHRSREYCTINHPTPSSGLLKFFMTQSFPKK